jgi:signal transduction histidine kinase
VRPLDFLSSIKVKLGAVIVAAVGVTILVVALGVRLGSNLAACGAVAGALALLMVQFLARGMTSPLREMADAASAMARGDYERRVTATSRDEVGDLARAFNSMAAELAETDRLRRDLVANVSHELRTPISALQAVLENLVDGVAPPDPAALKTMLLQVERLGRLVTQLLDLSRLESGAVPLQRGPFEVKPLLEQAVSESRLHNQNRGRAVAIDVSVQPGDLQADGDVERVHQVVTNLLENAVRHSPQDAKVVLRAMKKDGSVWIEVTDEGPGISPAEAQRVFERFYRTDQARSGSDGGTGLGLAIARWIVELHGGSIRAEQATPRGCRMVFELPATGRAA